MPISKIKALYSYVFILVFFVMILLPLKNLTLDPNAIEDSFYGRARLITLISNLRILIGDRVFPKAIVGDHGWLVFTGEDDLNDYQKNKLFTAEELAGFQKNLDTLNAAYAERGITLLVVIVPNKNTIYPERVPPQIPVLGTESRLEQVVNYLQAHGQTQLIDLRPALLRARQQREMYYATDTHWNEYGAYLAYAALMEQITKAFPDVTAHLQTDFKIVKQKPSTLDLANVIGETILRESRIRFVPKFDLQSSYKTITLSSRKIMFSSNPDQTLPEAVVYYDSFFFNVIPMLGEHFRSAVFVQNFTGGGLWNLSWVDREQPDVVIIEFAERYLRDLPDFIHPSR